MSILHFNGTISDERMERLPWGLEQWKHVRAICLGVNVQANGRDIVLDSYDDALGKVCEYLKKEYPGVIRLLNIKIVPLSEDRIMVTGDLWRKV